MKLPALPLLSSSLRAPPKPMRELDSRIQDCQEVLDLLRSARLVRLRLLVQLERLARSGRSAVSFEGAEPRRSLMEDLRARRSQIESLEEEWEFTRRGALREARAEVARQQEMAYRVRGAEARFEAFLLREAAKSLPAELYTEVWRQALLPAAAPLAIEIAGGGTSEEGTTEGTAEGTGEAAAESLAAQVRRERIHLECLRRLLRRSGRGDEAAELLNGERLGRAVRGLRRKLRETEVQLVEEEIAERRREISRLRLSSPPLPTRSGLKVRLVAALRLLVEPEVMERLEAVARVQGASAERAPRVRRLRPELAPVA